ncbi:helix-turn-helix domain-containing protein [Pararhodobacter sp. CCB-MM2]|uniref:helix-turn-helix domain-containing protein n=1 Tax=Pararhodobacter sp. CCB-MM2 TaxID=1786003 RepID=UPI000830D3DD|nr:helix-turn-helix domain-containing protein [Pararhodobacter sp. CCB-MM2]
MIWRKEQPPAQHEEGPRGFDDFELRLGDVLRGERATLGKSLLDVQRELHIRAAYIAAIENGDLEAFETPSFIAGFVRSYARYLGMEPEWVYERFCSEHGFQVAHGMAGSQAAARPSRSQPIEGRPGALKGVGLLPDPDPFWRRIEPGALGSVSVLLALILGLGYAGWTVLQEVQRVTVAPADIVPNVASDINPLAPEMRTPGSSLAANDTDPLAGVGTTRREDSATAVTGEGTGAEGRVRIARAPALEVPVIVPRDGPIAAIVPEAVNPVATAQAAATDDAVMQALSLASADQTTDPTAPQVLGAGPDTVELLAVRPSWLRVRGADGSVIFERILDAGERYTIPQTEEPPTLHAGNSGSVYFLINGQAYGPAAPGAQVVRNVALDAQALQTSFQVADLGRDEDLAVYVAQLRE